MSFPIDCTLPMLSYTGCVLGALSCMGRTYSTTYKFSCSTGSTFQTHKRIDVSLYPGQDSVKLYYLEKENVVKRMVGQGETTSHATL
jgi:hypothetical protein